MVRFTTLLVALLTSSFVEGFITAYPSNTKTTVSCGLAAKTILRLDILFYSTNRKNHRFTLPRQHEGCQIRLQLIPHQDVEAIMDKATDCAEGECSLDEVTDLIDALKLQQKELYDRVKQIKQMVHSLEIVNVHGNREVNEVRETVRAIFRIFQLGDKGSGNNYPTLTKATGWTGEVGGGPTTAYDSLPPKPWKKPSP
jgi:hypothetical protein